MADIAALRERHTLPTSSLRAIPVSGTTRGTPIGTAQLNGSHVQVPAEDPRTATMPADRAEWWRLAGVRAIRF
jgi:hypothetical protein